MCNEELWRDATQNKDPEAVSIGKLLDSDEMIRIYQNLKKAVTFKLSKNTNI